MKFEECFPFLETQIPVPDKHELYINISNEKHFPNFEWSRGSQLVLFGLPVYLDFQNAGKEWSLPNQTLRSSNDQAGKSMQWQYQNFQKSYQLYFTIIHPATTAVINTVNFFPIFNQHPL